MSLTKQNQQTYNTLSIRWLWKCSL